MRQFNQPGIKVLEIGSRSVVSDTLWKNFIPQVDYTGVDILDGENVTYVCDAHKLPEQFTDCFDLVISFAVFEHLAMPWLVAEQISKVLKPGGYFAIETHFSFSEHEVPWHFFQYNSRGLASLFNRDLGFKVIDRGLDTPIVGRFANAAPG